MCVCNRELHDDELLNAFKSRVNVLNYAPSNAELAVLMLDIASRGWPVGSTAQTIKPEDARQVAEHVISELIRLDCRFDMRLLTNKGFPLYQQWRDNETETDWCNLVTAAIEESLSPCLAPEEKLTSRADRIEGDRSVARKILKAYSKRKDRLRAWTEQTGKSERAFYRRWQEIDTF